MKADHLSLQTHALDFWLARGAVVLTAGLNLLLINKFSVLPWWLPSTFQIALLIPLSIATARTQRRVREAPPTNIGNSFINIDALFAGWLFL